MSREREAARAMRAPLQPSRSTTDEIVSQCDAGLISIAEARCALNFVVKRARRDANYSDSPESYKRFDREALAATDALGVL